MSMNFAFPDLGNVSLPYAGSVDIEINDLIFLCPSSPYPLPSGLTADVAYPAASLPDQGTAARNQRLFAKNFAGVSVERHLSSSSSSNDEMNTSVCPVWIGDADLAAATVCKPGMLVGVAENVGNNGIQSQVLSVVTDPALSIGVIVQDSGGNSVSTIRVALKSNLFTYGPFSPQIFEGVLREQCVYNAGGFTGGTTTTGTYTFTGKIPAGAVVTGYRAYVSTAFAGAGPCTAATVELGVSGSLGAYSGNTTQNVFATGPIGSAATNTRGAETAEVSPVATFALTGNTGLTAGVVTFEIFYTPPMSP